MHIHSENHAQRRTLQPTRWRTVELTPRVLSTLQCLQLRDIVKNRQLRLARLTLYSGNRQFNTM